MKKQMSILLLAILLCLTAGSQASHTSVDEPTRQEEQKKDNGVLDASDDLDSEAENGEPVESASESTKITVYCGNGDAAVFDTQEVEIGSLTPEELLAALVSKDAVSEEVKVLSFNKSTVDGKDTLVLDLNRAFLAYVLSMETSGEYYAIGSLCNTFLDAYFAEQIKITIEGATLETAHTDYSGYLTKFS